MISRRLGSGDQEQGRSVVGCMIWMWLVCAAGVTAAGLLFLEPLLEILGCTPEIRPYALEYGRVMLAGTVVSTGFSGVMRAEGDIFYSTLQWSFPVAVNMVLDPLFIYVFHWGIGGAAFATLIAQMVSMGTSIYYFLVRKSTPCRVGWKEIRWDKAAGREIISVGLPSFLNNLGNSLVTVIWNHMLGQAGGNTAISAYAVVERVQSFLITPFSGIMQGIQPIIGFDWGRKRIDRVRRTVFCAVRAGVIYGVSLTLICGVGAEIILGIFTKDAPVSQMGSMALRMICISFGVRGIMPVIQAFYQAVGDGKRVLFLSLGSIFAVRVPLILLMGSLENLTAMWSTFAVSDCMVTVCAVISYRKYQKEKMGWRA